MTKTATLTTGTRVRVQLPEWDGPGLVIYTVELITADEAIVREPRIPGLKGETHSFDVADLVIA